MIGDIAHKKQFAELLKQGYSALDCGRYVFPEDPSKAFKAAFEWRHDVFVKNIVECKSNYSLVVEHEVDDKPDEFFKRNLKDIILSAEKDSDRIAGLKLFKEYYNLGSAKSEETVQKAIVVTRFKNMDEWETLALNQQRELKEL